MTLRQEFENEIKATKGTVEFLFETDNQHYIAWLERRIMENDKTSQETNSVNNMMDLKKGDKVTILGDKTEQIWYFVTILEDGHVSLSDNEMNLYFGNKFVDPRFVKPLPN